MHLYNPTHLTTINIYNFTFEDIPKGSFCGQFCPQSIAK